MNNQLLLNHITKPFLSQNFDNYQIINNYSIHNNAIDIHNEKTIFFINNEIYIQLVSDINLTINLLNSFDGINAKNNNGNIFINGILWDGKKTNLNLFYNN